MAETDYRVPWDVDVVGSGHGSLADNANALVLSYHDNNGRHKFAGTNLSVTGSNIVVNDNENYLDITGTSTISSISGLTADGTTLVVGIIVYMKFASARTLTHNGSTFRLSGGNDVGVSANDIIGFRHLGSGSWEMISNSNSSPSSLIGRPSNLKIAYISATTMQITCSVIYKKTLTSVSRTLDISTGTSAAPVVEGRNFNSLTANQTVSVYLIENGSSINTLLSDNHVEASLSPLPTGYSSAKWIGAFSLDATSNLVSFVQYDNEVAYTERRGLTVGSATVASYTIGTTFGGIVAVANYIPTASLRVTGIKVGGVGTGVPGTVALSSSTNGGTQGSFGIKLASVNKYDFNANGDDAGAAAVGWDRGYISPSGDNILYRASQVFIPYTLGYRVNL